METTSTTRCIAWPTFQPNMTDLLKLDQAAGNMLKLLDSVGQLAWRLAWRIFH